MSAIVSYVAHRIINAKYWTPEAKAGFVAVLHEKAMLAQPGAVAVEVEQGSEWEVVVYFEDRRSFEAAERRMPELGLEIAGVPVKNSVLPQSGYPAAGSKEESAKFVFKAQRALSLITMSIGFAMMPLSVSLVAIGTLQGPAFPYLWETVVFTFAMLAMVFISQDTLEPPEIDERPDSLVVDSYGIPNASLLGMIALLALGGIPLALAIAWKLIAIGFWIGLVGWLFLRKIRAAKGLPFESEATNPA